MYVLYVSLRGIPPNSKHVMNAQRLLLNHSQTEVIYVFMLIYGAVYLADIHFCTRHFAISPFIPI